MHDPNMAILFADTIVMVRNGKIIARGPAPEVMTKTNIDALYETDTVPVKISDTQHFFLPGEMING